MKKPSVLRTVSDKFNLFNSGRIDSQNFMPAIASIRKTLDAPLVKQGFELGEHYGYFGHEVRAKTGKLRPSDVEFIEGTKVNVVPDCRTTHLSVSDDGTVDFTQEIYDTDGGKAMSVMIDSNVGGWSWATNSANGHRIMTDFAGIDYVKRPNYISTENMMLASTAPSREDIIASLVKSGLSESEANEKYEALDADDSVSRVEHNSVVEELELMHLANDNKEDQKISDIEQASEKARADSQALMLACIERLPVFVTEETKALALQSTGEPNEALTMILASVGNMSEQDKLMLASANNVTASQDTATANEGKSFESYEEEPNFNNKA